MPHSSFELNFGLANIFYQSCQYHKAETRYLELARDERLLNREKIWEYLAWTYLQLAKKKEALKYSRRCLSENEKNLNAKFIELILQEQVDKGDYLIKRLINLLQDNRFFYRPLAELMYIEPNPRKRKKYFEDLRI